MSLGRRADKPTDAGGMPGGGGGGTYGFGSWPFPLLQVGPKGQQPVPSQFVTDLETGEPAILPWGKSYADVSAGTLATFPPSRFGPPYPGISYDVTPTGISWKGLPAGTADGSILGATVTLRPAVLLIGLAILFFLWRR